MPTATLRKQFKKSVHGLSSVGKRKLTAAKRRTNNFLQRRPHRSFRRTYRRDYVRTLTIPGYWAFTQYVLQTLWRQRKTFALVALVYAVLTGTLVGLTSQDRYKELGDTIQATSGDLFNGSWGQVGEASLLFLTTITGGVNTAPSEAQQIYSVLISLLIWLTTVWLLRNLIAGHTVRVRDGLYSSGAPLLSTLLVGLVVVVQLLPLVLALIGYSAAQASGLLDSGAAAMLFWFAAGLLATLSLYWATSTFIAMIIITLPGMYPMQAIKTAGDLVVGRRIRILFRLLWLGLLSMIALVLIMLPIIMIDAWIKELLPAISWLPIVPLSVLIVSAAGVVWIAGYVYLLYRKVVEDDAKPAL